MSPSRPAYSLLARAMLVAVVLAAVLQSPGAQGVPAVGDWERRSAQAQRVLHRRAEQNLRMERAQAHAHMPDTMYASTPDPSPPHPLLLEVGTESTTERSASVPARAAERLGYRVGLFPAASRWTQEPGYQGFVRIINRSDEAGEVRIDAWDDNGTHRGPVTLAIGVGETKHFNSDDLEMGNAGKEIEGSTGPGKGDWRLALSSTLELDSSSTVENEKLSDVNELSSTGNALALHANVRRDSQRQLSEALVSSLRLNIDLAHGVGQSDPDALGNLASNADGVAAHHEGLAIVGNRSIGQRIQIAQNVIPLCAHASVVHATKELVAQHQRQERAEYMSADCGIGLMEDGAGVEQALGGAEDLLDHPQLFIA